jgi:hypothetical protein
MSDSNSGRRKPATPKEMIGWGLVCSAIGLYFILVGAGALPAPGGPKNLHAPLWVIAFCGLPFLLGGIALALQGFGKANEQGELPADAPHWIRVVQYLIGVAIFASFAVVGSWIAIGGDARQFSGSFGGWSGGVGAGIGRTVFGLGAIIVWLCTIGFAVSGARKLFGAPKG